MNEYSLVQMTERFAIDISSWTYPPPYDRYNFEPWEEALAERKELADPGIRERQYRAVLEHGTLCGFVQWFPLAGEDGLVIRLGLGLRPDLCGQGRGAAFASFLAATTAEQFPGAEIDLETTADNIRAIKAYERAGFRKVDEYDIPAPGGTERIICMVWDKQFRQNC